VETPARQRRQTQRRAPSGPGPVRAGEKVFLPNEPLSEPVPRAEVEVGIARRRTRRIDAGDFEPDTVFESQFEPLVDRDDPGAGDALARAKPVRKRNHGREARPGAKAELRAREAAPRPAPKRANLPPLSSARVCGVELIFDRSRMDLTDFRPMNIQRFARAPCLGAARSATVLEDGG